jgi:hypothetical protein
VCKEDFVKLTLCGLILMMAIGCSDSPTAPTPTQTTPAPTPTASGPTVVTLDWAVTAASCGAPAAPPSAPSIASATIVQQSDSSLTATWPYQSNGRSVTLYARFVRENNRWALCSWDVADV